MKIVNDVLEISFFDLNGVAQQMFLRAMEIITPSEGNYDMMPIAVVSIPEKEETVKESDIEVFKLSDPDSVKKLHEKLDEHFGR